MPQQLYTQFQDAVAQEDHKTAIKIALAFAELTGPSVVHPPEVINTIRGMFPLPHDLPHDVAEKAPELTAIVANSEAARMAKQLKPSSGAPTFIKE